MPDASTAPDLSPTFEEFDESHIDDVVELGEAFFNESEFGEFSEFSPENFRRALEAARSTHGVVFTINGRVEGFIFFQLDVAYTKAPIALMWLLYVSPEYRRSPVGRELLRWAEDWARDLGATAFYGGSMAGIPSIAKTMRNMYRKAGYEDLYWGRKVLTGDDNG